MVWRAHAVAAQTVRIFGVYLGWEVTDAGEGHSGGARIAQFAGGGEGGGDFGFEV